MAGKQLVKISVLVDVEDDDLPMAEVAQAVADAISLDWVGDHPICIREVAVLP